MALLSLLKGAESISSLRDRDTATMMAATAIIHLLDPISLCWLQARESGQFLRVLTEMGAQGLICQDQSGGYTLETLFAHCPEARMAVETQRTCGVMLPNTHYKVILPYLSGSRLVSLLIAECYQPPSFEKQDGIYSFLSFYANYLSLLDYGERDSLTGLFNRRTFDESFEKMLHTVCHRTRHKDRRRACSGDYWLAVLDIDRFKRINDNWGHLFGDEVLLRFAHLLRLCFREDDRLYRFGGEEFVVLLRADGDRQAWDVLERFRLRLSGSDFPQVGQVTCCIGFAAVDPAQPPVNILDNADQALYFAKGNGRNQTHQYETLVDQGLIQSRGKVSGSNCVDFDIDALFD